MQPRWPRPRSLASLPWWGRVTTECTAGCLPLGPVVPLSPGNVRTRAAPPLLCTPRVVLLAALGTLGRGAVLFPPVRIPCALGNSCMNENYVHETNGPHISCYVPFVVAQGTEIWSSPLQPAALVNVVTFPRLQLAVTVDERGLIKVWEAENGWERASFCLPTFSSALQACDHLEGPFLLVSKWLLSFTS